MLKRIVYGTLGLILITAILAILLYVFNLDAENPLTLPMAFAVASLPIGLMVATGLVVVCAFQAFRSD